MRRLKAYGRFWKFLEVSESCKILQVYVERCDGVSPVWRYILTILSGEILYKCDEYSSVVSHIAVSLTLK